MTAQPSTVETTMSEAEADALIADIGAKARAATAALGKAAAAAKTRGLHEAAERVRNAANSLLDANAGDCARAEANGISPAFLDRLRLTPERIEGIARGLDTVTADAGGLCVKAGNAAVLRGGSDSFETSGLLIDCLQDGLAAAGLPREAVQRIPSRDRAAVGAMLRARGLIDVIVPRGGAGLTERVFAEARMPVIGHLEGLCHL